jgi:secreted trypsin-like serine protease
MGVDGTLWLLFCTAMSHVKHLKRSAQLLVASLSITSLIFAAPSNAIEGGYSSPSLVGATVALLDSETGTSPYCSGMLLDEHVIATAAHCVIDTNGSVRSNIWISPAGADLSTSPKLTTAAQVFNVAGWKNSTSYVRSDDIAFVTTKNSLGKPIFSKILNQAEVKALYGQSVILSGYGRKGTLQAASQKPLFLQQRVIDWVIDAFPFGTYTHVVATDTETPCPGDSGGPIFKEDAGKYYAVGVIAGGNGCTTVNRKEEREVGFIIAAFNTLYQQALTSLKTAPYAPQNLVVIENNGDVKVSWAEVPNRLLTSTTAYEIVDGNKKVLCRAEQVSIFRNARECAFQLDVNSASPISIVPIGVKTNGSPIDLKLDGAVSRVKNAASEKVTAEAKAAADRVAAEAKAAADRVAAEAKAAADRVAAEAKAAADRVAAEKKTTITCVKGKLVKKVRSQKPKCPSGYKKK